MSAGIWRDIRWAVTAFRAKRLRHRLSFAARVRFDDELRPKVWADEMPNPRIAYPDALYHITGRDFNRATAGLSGTPGAVEEHRWNQTKRPRHPRSQP